MTTQHSFWYAFVRPLFPTLIGIGLAIAYGLMAHYAFGEWLWQGDAAAILTCSFLFLVPLALGGLTISVSPSTEKPSIWYAIFMPWISCTAFMVVLLLFQLEFMVCVILALPAFLFISSVGGIVVWSMKWSKSAVLIFLIAPYTAAPLELQIETRPLAVTTYTQIHIEATAEEVWAQIASVPLITEAEHEWNFFHAIGLPRPVSAELIGEGVGAQRDARFEDGLVFAETITAWQPNELIAFTIEAQSQPLLPAPLNMIGSEQFNVLQGQYVIEPLADGSVILYLSSEHVLQTRFNEYGMVWTDLIMADLQNYILRVIKARAEQ